MTFKELEKVILADGWYHVKTTGSHYQYKHHEKLGKVTIPNHKGDLNIKTAKSILKLSGIKN